MTTIPEELKCIIESKDGPVCGYIDKTGETTCYKFKGIPYAKPPLGCLRFLPPFPVNPWKDIIDCTKDAPIPLQYYMKTDIIGSEDCLYIDVITPSIQNDKPLPVMFWIGCLGFTFSLDPIYDPMLLNAQNVIFVRCGFRMGPLGFLSIQDFTAPGNCGLKDIVMALKWVQRNISAFGGDPTNVTIFGSSSGGVIVHLMMISPMATGLFHRAIIQSVSALNTWSITKNPCQFVTSLAETLGIQKTDNMAIIEELRSISASDIMNGFAKILHRFKEDKERDVIDLLIKPCVEIEFESQPAFLSRSPASLLKLGNFNKVPLIIGSNNIEASVLEFTRLDFYCDFKNFNENVHLLVPRALAAEIKKSKTIGQRLLQFYLGGEEQLTEDTKTQFLQLISDYYFLYYINKTVRLHVQLAPECPVYYYIVNYAGEWSVPPTLKFFNSLGHNAEVPFIFQIKTPDSPACKGSRDSVTTRRRVIKMWTNFAKYGNPTPDSNDRLLQIKWDPVENNEKLKYLNIGSELTKGTNPFQERMEFWEDLHKENTILRTLVYFNDMGITW